jgi:hypothetical protein
MSQELQLVPGTAVTVNTYTYLRNTKRIVRLTDIETGMAFVNKILLPC